MYEGIRKDSYPSYLAILWQGTRISNNPDLKVAYDKAIMEYGGLERMCKINSDSIFIAKPYFYLPHRSVFKPQSTPTTLRY